MIWQSVRVSPSKSEPFIFQKAKRFFNGHSFPTYFISLQIQYSKNKDLQRLVCIKSLSNPVACPMTASLSLTKVIAVASPVMVTPPSGVDDTGEWEGSLLILRFPWRRERRVPETLHWLAGVSTHLQDNALSGERGGRDKTAIILLFRWGCQRKYLWSSTMGFKGGLRVVYKLIFLTFIYLLVRYEGSREKTAMVHPELFCWKRISKKFYVS